MISSLGYGKILQIGCNRRSLSSLSLIFAPSPRSGGYPRSQSVETLPKQKDSTPHRVGSAFFSLCRWLLPRTATIKQTPLRTVLVHHQHNCTFPQPDTMSMQEDCSSSMKKRGGTAGAEEEEEEDATAAAADGGGGAAEQDEPKRQCRTTSDDDSITVDEDKSHHGVEPLQQMRNAFMVTLERQQNAMDKAIARDDRMIEQQEVALGQLKVARNTKQRQRDAVAKQRARLAKDKGEDEDVADLLLLVFGNPYLEDELESEEEGDLAEATNNKPEDDGETLPPTEEKEEC